MKGRMFILLTAGAMMLFSSASFADGYYGHGYYHHGWYGPPLIIGDPWGPPPVYYGPPPVYVSPPPPQIYIEKTPQYGYYCRNPAGYYPRIPRCPSGWMKVAADAPASR